ncbi:MAG: hypothetical protein KIT07_06745 [Anaerolineales bacterium]|jgi:hypothetical protein|nr:hypothetical protein [Anaerolineales bacterium]
MATQVADWLALKAWQFAVGALSLVRPLGASARRAAQRLRSQPLHAAHSTEAAVAGAAPVSSRQPTWQRVLDNWTLVAGCGWLLGLWLGMWIAGVW